jgi:hypothetical protein
MKRLYFGFWFCLAILFPGVFLGCASSDSAHSIAKTDTSPHDFVVQVNQEFFVVRLVDPQLISKAWGRIAGSVPQGIVSGKLADTDGGFNRDPNSQKAWTWHLIPETVSFPQLSMEVCDGRPSDVEGNKQHWLNDVRMYCPWQAKIIREITTNSGKK